MAATDKASFVFEAISDHKASKRYQQAAEAQKYYDCENPTINRYFKILYDMQGQAHKDIYSANHKIASNFFRFVVDQEVSYLLSNGIRFNSPDTEKKLGGDFSNRVCDALTQAEVGGESFGFWNHDHLEVFQLADDESTPGFVPLYDEENGALMAGIRYWQLDENKPVKATLYEISGITSYQKTEGGKPEMVGAPERPYVVKRIRSVVDGEQVLPGDPYPGLPIFPLRYDRKARTALSGKRNTVDALDLVTSNLVNDVDEGNLIYWILTNCDGMDDLDDAKFIERLKTTRVSHVNGDEGAKADPHTIEAPFAGTQNAIDTLIHRLYTDFQAFDPSAVSAGNQTATAIRASYVPLDLKADKTENQVTEFISTILRFIGIEDKPTYQRNMIVNATEETERILTGAPYYTEDYVTRKLLALNGDADQADEIIKQRAADEMKRFEMMQKEADNNDFPEGRPE